MAKVKRTVTVDLGAATRKDGEYLEHQLLPAGGKAITIPILPGFDPPVSFLYVSKVSTGKSDYKVQAALTLDIAKLALGVPRAR